MALQVDHREARMSARFDYYRLKKAFGLNLQVGMRRTFLLLDIDRQLDKLEGDNFEEYFSRLEQNRELLGLPGGLESQLMAAFLVQ